MVRKKASFEEDGFLQQIVACPDDDAPRLIFADWLEERGDPRGAFIRVQCQLAGPSPDLFEREQLLKQESALLKLHRAEWSKSVPHYVKETGYRRGFLETVVITAAHLLWNADALFRHVPTVRRLRILHLRDHLPEIANAPWMERIVELDVSGNELGGRSLQALAQSSYCKHIEILDLNNCKLNQASIACLAAAPNFQSVRILRMKGNQIGSEGMHAIARAPGLQNLRRLSLDENQIEDQGAIALTDEPTFLLEKLVLGGNRIGNSGATAVAQCAKFAGLRQLRLDRNQISNVGVQALATSPILHHLEELWLDYNRISDRGLRDLASSKNLASLVRLNVAFNEFSFAAAEELRASGNFPNMRWLDARR